MMARGYIRPGLIGLVGLCASLLLLAAGASPALADRSYESQITGFSDPHGVTIDSSNNAWISDPGHGGLITEYNSSSAKIGEQTGEGHYGAHYIWSLALDSTNGYLYVADSGPEVVDVFSPSTFVEQWPLGGSYDYVAVDNSTGPSKGRVYIASPSGPGVRAFNPNHTEANFSASESYVSGNTITGTPNGSFGRPWNIAVDNDGNIYVVDQNKSVVDEFRPSGEFVQEFNGAGAPTAFSGDLTGVAVDPTNGNVLVVDSGNDVVDEFESSGAYLDQITGTSEITPFGSLEGGIAVNSEGYLYIADGAAGVVDIFSPNIPLPKITYKPVSNATPTSGTLNAKIDPNGAGEDTSCYFEYGATGTYGSPHVPCEPAPPYSTPTEVSANISGLTPETTYHYRAVVTDASGNTRKGSDQTFTPHAVAGLTTEAATNVGPTSATLNGSFVGNGEDTHYFYEWGATESYGHKTAVENAGSPTGPTPTSLPLNLSGLVPQTTYHYRVVATNGFGTTRGGDQTLTTPPAIAALTTEAATNVGPTSATLNGAFVGNGEDTHYHFEYVTGQQYSNEGFAHATAAPLPEGDAGSPTGPTAVHVNIENLIQTTEYHFRIVASSRFGSTYGNELVFTTTASAPLVAAGSVSAVHSSSALLHDRIDPGGSETTYHFEFGTADCSISSCTKIPVPDVALGSENYFLSVSAELSGLIPGTTYHYRVVATNGLGVTDGPDSTFTTFPFVPQIHETCANGLARQQTGAALLLDCRAYELVSSAESGGYDVESNLVPGQAPYAGYPEGSGATGTSRVLYGVHDGALPGVAGHPTNRGVDPYIATRTEEGWETKYVGIPANDPFASEPFSSVPTGASAALGAFAFGGEGSCSPCFEGGYTGIPVRLEDGELVQGMVAASNVPAPGPSASPDGYIGSDLSANGEHLIFGSTSQFAPGGNNGTGDVSIYDHNMKSGETHVISNNTATEDFPVPLPCLQGKGQCSAAHKDSNGIAELAISTDGSHILLGQKVSADADGNVYWHLYMDVNDAITSIDLTPGVISEHGGPGFSEGVLFDGMSEDGSKVFFTTKDKLLSADTDESADIYEAEVSGSSATLHLISAGEGGAPSNSNSCEPVSNSVGEHWNTVGSSKNCDAVAIGGGGGVASQDGAIYFLSPELLAGSAEPQDGIKNAPNLYLATPGEAPHYVTTLSPEDSVVLDSVSEAKTRHTADFQVTPSGRFAVFGTIRRLGAYENDGYAEVYRYDATTRKLDCASCDPTNAQAIGNASLASNGSSLTNDGRVFFNTDDALVLRDTDNRQDVYEWEATGTGTCQVESPDFFSFNGDCLGLISSGSSPFDSGLLGVSADGTDAFFFTHDTLSSQDHNGPITKIYDARTDGGFFEVPKPPPCASSDECHGPGSQAPGPSAIRTTAGSPSNYTPRVACKVGFVANHGRCVRKPHKRKRRHKRAIHHHHGGGK